MNAPFDSKPISQNQLFWTTCLTLSYGPKERGHAAVRHEHSLSPDQLPRPARVCIVARVAAETPNGVPGRPINPHTSCNSGDSGRLSLLAGDHTATSFFLARLPP